MNNKTLAAISYLTIIGWLVAFFIGKDKADEFLKFHLGQSLGLALLLIALNVISSIPGLSDLGILYLAVLIFIVAGIIHSLNEEQKPLPLIGNWIAKNLKVFK